MKKLVKVKAKENSREKINPRNVHKSYLEKMESSLADKGVVFFDPDVNLNISEGYLELPAELTDVPSKELGEYLNAFTQQKVYLRTLLGRIESSVEEAKRAYFESSEKLYRRLTADKVSETAKERIVSTDPSIIPFYHEYVDCKRKQSLIEYSILNIEDIIFMLSREVTRRTGDFLDENRSYNVGRK